MTSRETEAQTNISIEYRYKIPHSSATKPNLAMYERDLIAWQLGLILGMQGWCRLM